jgi:hypothetical protein
MKETDKTNAGHLKIPAPVMYSEDRGDYPLCPLRAHRFASETPRRTRCPDFAEKVWESSPFLSTLVRTAIHIR